MNATINTGKGRKIGKVITSTLFVLALGFGGMAMPIDTFANVVTPACPFTAQSGRTIVDFNVSEQFGSPSYAPHESSPINVNLATGKYKVSIFSFDGYVGRENLSQPHEQWYVKFMNGTTLVVKSNAVSDLQDFVQSASKTEVVNDSLTILQSITSVTAFHAFYPDNTSYNSVIPLCAAFDKLDETQSLVVSCNVSPSQAEIGQNVSYTSNVSGGTGVYSYSWTGTDNLTGTSQGVSKTYSTIGSKLGTVTVTSGTQTKTATCSTAIVDTPDFTLSCSANPTSAQIGQSVNYAANVNGGTGSFTFSWTGTDSLSAGNVPAVSKTYASAGAKSATVTATSGSRTKTATCNTVIQESTPDLGGSCIVNKSTAELDKNVTFTAQGTGGTGSYTYEWTGSGISWFDLFTSRILTRSFNTTGNKTLNVKITSGNQSVIRSCTVLIQDTTEDLGGSCTGTPSTIDKGETVTWKATATGGDGNYEYDWSGTNSLIGSSRTVSKTYSSEGTKTATVEITSDGHTITRSCTIKVEEEDEDDLEVSCKASPRHAEVDEKVTFTATVDGGNSPYDYDWDGDDNLSGDDKSITHRYDDEGNYEAEVTVTDDDGNRDTARCEVDVDETDENIDVYTDTNPTVSQVYLTQVPYTGSSPWKIMFYVLAFLAWTGVISYYILKAKYGWTLATVGAKAENFSDIITSKLNSLRTSQKISKKSVENQNDNNFNKFWDNK